MIKPPLVNMWFFLKRVIDHAERIADPGTQQADKSNQQNGDEHQDDGVLDQPLSFFLDVG